MTLKLVSQKEELLQILVVQAQNHASQLAAETQGQKGFVTVRHSYEQLQQLQAKAPQVIATAKGEVVAYALVMLQECKDLIPVLVPMFQTFDQVSYKEKPLSALNYYVMGQICVRDDFKRQGLFGQLYQKHKEVYAPQFDYCVTEVSSSNIPSLRAHEKVGFKTIHTFRDATDQWHIMLWDWS